MSLVTLRLRGPTGVTTIQLSPDASFFELQAAVFSATNIAPELQEIRTGHPPRTIDTTGSQDASITSLGLKNGEVLIVQEARAGSSAAKPLTTQTRSPPPQATVSTTVSSPSKPPTIPIRSDSEVGPGKLTTAAANRRLPLPAPIHSKPADTQGRQPGRNARPQQPFGPPVGSTAPSGAKPGLTSTEDAVVRVDGGWIVLRVVPDDNSCMFTALAILLEHDKTGSIQALRQTVADTIKADPFTWSEAVLGMKPSTYCEKIVKKETWGGAIELAIASDKYKIEIISIDVQSGRTDRFGEEHKYENHILLVYSGIHYDAITFTPLEPTGSEVYPYSLNFDQTIFSKDTEGFALAAASELVRKLRDRHYYTDVAGFALRCEVCKKALKGEKEAQQHAAQTGHANFGEFQ